MLRTADLEYDLPEEWIATAPVSPRDAAKLMVVWRSDPSRVEHRRVRDLPEYLRAGDLLVLNTTRVLPARFAGEREDSHGGVQGLYLGQRGAADDHWAVMIKSRRQAPGVRIALKDRHGGPSGVVLELVERDEEPGAWVARVHGAGGGDVLGRVGLTPLPPYILQARKHAGLAGDDEVDRLAYQTVYAEGEDRHGQDARATHGLEARATGSVAAPTAGLHFTPELLAGLGAAGVRRADVVLHVGTGTFKPVETEYVEQHPMHAEWCTLPGATGRAVVEARARGGRVVAVGTTAARTLESFEAAGLGAGGSRETRLLITPGYAWKHVDVLMTNFHLPRSTLMALVAAGLGGDGAAVERLKSLYELAMESGYRFYSFGDAMLVLP